MPRQRPPAAAQPLAFLAAQLHVFTMIPSTDETLMRHWLAHYTGLGVRPSHIQVLVDPQRDPARGAGMAALLSPLGVNYTFALRQYHSDLKRDAANAFLRALPADAWAISADADEFFRFPSNMEKLVRDEAPGHDGLFATYFAERIGANFSFPPLRAAPSIAEQFPIECAGFRAALLPNFNAQDYKTALFRVRDRAGRTRQIEGSHALAPEFYKTPRGGAVNPRYLPFVPHFSFFGGPPGSSSFIDLALHKQEVYMRASPPRAVVYTKTLELFDLDHWRAAGEVRLSPAGRQRCEALCEVAPQTPNLKKQLDRRRNAVKTFQAASSPFGDLHHAGHGG